MNESQETTLANSQASGVSVSVLQKLEAECREDNLVTGAILQSAIKVHKALGPGLLESVYQACLMHELEQLHMRVKKQVAMPLVYEGIQFKVGYRLDLLVEDKVIVEIKTVERLNAVHKAQLLTYLKLSGKRLGLLITFNTQMLRNGVCRLIR